MNISYDHYRIFYNVAKYKSFTRAAEVMYANQPNLTRAVKTLEKQLGCTLFERTNKGVRLTSDGKLKPCLHAEDEYSIKGLDFAGVKAVMEQAIWNKPAWHGDLDAVNRSKAGRNMNEIGG